MSDRIHVALLLAGAGVLAAAGAPAAGRPPGVAANFRIEKLADGVYGAVRNDPPGLMCDGNSAFIIGETDVVVVDAPESTAEVIAALRRLTDKPVRYVINTHWHDDHITGNQAYREAYPGVEFIAHAAARDYLPGQGTVNRRKMIEGAPQGAAMLTGLLEQGRSLAGSALSEEERASYESDIALVENYLAVVPGSPIVLPTIAVQDRLTLHRGGRTIEIRHLGRGHTAGDLVVHLPAEKIAITGDLVVWPVPLVGAEQSYIADWSATLQALRGLGPALYLPGHGPVLHDDSHVRRMAELFESVQLQTESAAPRSAGLDELRKRIDLSPFRTMFAGDSPLRAVLFDTYVASPAVAAAYREIPAGS